MGFFGQVAREFDFEGGRFGLGFVDWVGCGVRDCIGFVEGVRFGFGFVDVVGFDFDFALLCGETPLLQNSNEIVSAKNSILILETVFAIRACHAFRFEKVILVVVVAAEGRLLERLFCWRNSRIFCLNSRLLC